MELKKFLTSIMVIFLVGLIFIYYFLPTEKIDFVLNENPDFNIGNETSTMQFYENMRFPNSLITFQIDDTCSIQKKSEMREAFSIIQNLTIIEFEETRNGEISITCEDKNRIEGGMFIAGEGGPTKIISSNNFNVIFNGEILLIRDSQCENPNVAIHELLHVLGFNHSTNEQNIMYPISKCSQTVGNQITDELDRLYSIPSYSDLLFENASAKKEGRYLDLNITLRNGGLIIAEPSKLIVFGDGEVIREIDLKELEVGTGITMEIKNLDTKITKIEELKLVIQSDFEELSKDNNQIYLDKIYL